MGMLSMKHLYGLVFIVGLWAAGSHDLFASEKNGTGQRGLTETEARIAAKAYARLPRPNNEAEHLVLWRKALRVHFFGALDAQTVSAINLIGTMYTDLSNAQIGLSIALSGTPLADEANIIYFISPNYRQDIAKVYNNLPGQDAEAKKKMAEIIFKSGDDATQDCFIHGVRDEKFELKYGFIAINTTRSQDRIKRCANSSFYMLSGFLPLESEAVSAMGMDRSASILVGADAMTDTDVSILRFLYGNRERFLGRRPEDVFGEAGRK